MRYYIYILTNAVNSVLYTGITNNLERRIYEHKHDLVDGFSRLYKLHKLVYVEEYPDVRQALEREKQLKRWHRGWKFNLIRSKNPELIDLERS